MHGLTAGVGEHRGRERVGELEQLPDDHRGSDHAEHRCRQVRRDAAHHRRRVAREQPLDQAEEHEPEKQDARDVAHRRVRRTGAGEPRGFDVRSCRRQQEVHDAVDEERDRAEDPARDSPGRPCPMPTRRAR